jgi:sugar-specific transcriptional regulator TrmB
MAGNIYWEEIERYFAKKRGNALILSPKDWPLVTAWEERGIPLEVIYQGIDKAFERSEEKQKTSQRQTIRTLAYCQYDVEELWSERKEAIQAKSQNSKEDLHQTISAECRRVSTKIRSVSEHLRKYAQDPHYSCIKNELMSSSEALDSLTPLVSQVEDNVALSQAKQEIRNIERELVSRLEQAIGPNIRQELHTKAETKLASYRKNMNENVYQETLRIAFLQVLRDAYPLPAFL